MSNEVIQASPRELQRYRELVAELNKDTLGWNQYSGPGEKVTQKTMEEVAQFHKNLDTLIKKLSFDQVYQCCKLAIQYAAEEYNNSSDLAGNVQFWAKKASDYRNHFKSVIHGE